LAKAVERFSTTLLKRENGVATSEEPAALLGLNTLVVDRFPFQHFPKDDPCSVFAAPNVTSQLLPLSIGPEQ
jgi:hypothetical protein